MKQTEWDLETYKRNYDALMEKARRLRAERDAYITANESSWTINGERKTWQEMYDREKAERLRLEAYRALLSDLDRCEHGRHEGDVCSECHGDSHGNPHLQHGQTLGYSLEAKLYRVPEGRGYYDIAKWTEPPEDGDCQHLWHETRTIKRAERCPACNEENA